jgi:hypothetical protein
MGATNDVIYPGPSRPSKVIVVMSSEADLV